MSEPPNTERADDADRIARRNKLLTRVVIVGLGLLVLAYVIPLFIHR